jgi:hypothetical protein
LPELPIHYPFLIISRRLKASEMLAKLAKGYAAAKIAKENVASEAQASA